MYTGMVGQALTMGEGVQPWYVYAAGLSVIAAFFKVVGDIATSLIEAVEEED